MRSLTPTAVSLPLHVGLDERKGLGADGQSAFCSKTSISAEQKAREMIRREGGRWMEAMTV